MQLSEASQFAESLLHILGDHSVAMAQFNPFVFEFPAQV
jgi:hypothetical protein